MTEQVRVAKQHQDTAPSDSAPLEAKDQHEVGDALKAELDELLDEIDGVLEENAEAFVRDYVQKGGE